MADIAVETFDVDVGADGTTYTLTNDVGSLANAFIRHNTTTSRTSSGPIGSTGYQYIDVIGVGMEITGTDEITWHRESSTPVKVVGEVWRYTGAPGGDHEFINRGTYAVTVNTSGDTTYDLSSAGIVDVNKCVPFITGYTCSTSNNYTAYRNTVAAHINSSGDLILTRGGNYSTTVVYVQIIEFTGTAWSVGHAVSSSHDSATETITLNTASDGISGSTFDVGSWSNAFLEASMGGDTTEYGLADTTALVSPSSGTTIVDFSVTALDVAARNDSVGYVHAIVNSSINVYRNYDADAPEGANTYGVISWPTGAPTDKNIEELALEWFSGTSGTGTNFPKGSLGGRITDATGTITHWVSCSGNTVKIRYGVIDLSGLTYTAPSATVLPFDNDIALYIKEPNLLTPGRKPSGPVEINREHPLARGLEVALIHEGNNVVTPYGTARDGQEMFQTTIPSVTTGFANSTVIYGFYCAVVPVWNANASIYRDGDTSHIYAGHGLNIESPASYGYVILGSRDTFGTYRRFGNDVVSGSLVAGQKYVFAATVEDDYTVNCYNAGEYVSTNTAFTAYTFPQNSGGVVQWGSATTSPGNLSDPSLLFVLRFSRVLSDDEIRMLSNDPYQVLKPVNALPLQLYFDSITPPADILSLLIPGQLRAAYKNIRPEGQCEVDIEGIKSQGISHFFDHLLTINDADIDVERKVAMPPLAISYRTRNRKHIYGSAVGSGASTTVDSLPATSPLTIFVEFWMFEQGATLAGFFGYSDFSSGVEQKRILVADGGYFKLYFGVTLLSTSLQVPEDGLRHTVAFVYEGGSSYFKDYSVYLDGQLKEFGSYPGFTPDASGVWLSNIANPFTGTINDMELGVCFVAPKIMSEAEIFEWHNNTYKYHHFDYNSIGVISYDTLPEIPTHYASLSFNKVNAANLVKQAVFNTTASFDIDIAMNQTNVLNLLAYIAFGKTLSQTQIASIVLEKTVEFNSSLAVNYLTGLTLESVVSFGNNKAVSSNGTLSLESVLFFDSILTTNQSALLNLFASNVFSTTSGYSTTTSNVIEAQNYLSSVFSVDNSAKAILEAIQSYSETKGLIETSKIILNSLLNLENILHTTYVSNVDLSANAVFNESFSFDFVNNKSTDASTSIDVIKEVIKSASTQFNTNILFGKVSEYSLAINAALLADVTLSSLLSKAYTTGTLINGNISFNIISTVTLLKQVIFNVVSSFSMDQGVSSSNNAVLSALQSFGVLQEIQPTSIAVLESEVSFNFNTLIEADDADTTINASVAYSLLKGYATQTGAMTLNSTLSVGVINSLTNISIANLYAASTLNSNVIFTVDSGNIIDTAISYAINHSDIYSVGLTLTGNLLLENIKSLAFANNKNIDVVTSFTQQIGLQSVAQAILNAGLPLNKIVNISYDGQAIALTIDLPDGRTLIVRIENRLLIVDEENRLLEATSENRGLHITEEYRQLDIFQEPRIVSVNEETRHLEISGENRTLDIDD